MKRERLFTSQSTHSGFDQGLNLAHRLNPAQSLESGISQGNVEISLGEFAILVDTEGESTTLARASFESWSGSQVATHQTFFRERNTMTKQNEAAETCVEFLKQYQRDDSGDEQ